MAATRPPRKKKPAPDSAAAGLRREAAERLHGLGAGAASPSSLEELAGTVHELRVHQIELEMQNEELCRVQLELDAQREKYVDLFDLAPVGYITLSDEGIVRDANSTAAQLLGTQRRELLDKPFTAFVYASDQDAYYLYSRLLEKTGAPQSCELRLQPAGAEPLWAHLESRPQGGADGEPFRYQVTFADVHERVSAEAALHESEQRFRALVEWTPEAIVVHRDGTLIYVNPAAVRMFGATSAEDLVGRSMLELIHPDFHQIVLDRVKKGLEDDLGAPLIEIRYLKLDGTTIEAEVQGTPIIYDGAPAIHVALRDVTARKQAEEALGNAGDRLSLATRAGGVGIWDWDLDSDVLTWDEQMFALYGITREQFGGAYEAWRAGLHPDDEERGDAEI